MPTNVPVGLRHRGVDRDVDQGDVGGNEAREPALVQQREVGVDRSVAPLWQPLQHGPERRAGQRLADAVELDALRPPEEATDLFGKRLLQVLGPLDSTDAVRAHDAAQVADG